MNFDIEKLLSDLPLKQPSAELDRRIDAAFWSARWNRRLRWTSLAGAAVAAAVVGALTLNLAGHKTESAPGPGSTVTAPPHVFDPSGMVNFSRDISETVPAGVYRGQDGTPVRAYRRVGVKDVWTVDPVTGQRVKTRVPQEETILVPANFD